MGPQNHPISGRKGVFNPPIIDTSNGMQAGISSRSRRRGDKTEDEMNRNGLTVKTRNHGASRNNWEITVIGLNIPQIETPFNPSLWTVSVTISMQVKR